MPSNPPDEYSTPRNDQGVKKRVDGKGDPWAKAHRDELGKRFVMSDMDGYFGHFGFAANTGDRLFMEYVPDEWRNHDRLIRQFAVVAMFDRKTTEAWAFHSENMLSRAFYLWLCRTLGGLQPVPPRFFYIVGTDAPPWQMIELDIETGRVAGRHNLPTKDWKPLWEAVGLTDMRRSLERLLCKPKNCR